MLTEHEFSVLINRLKNGKRRAVDVDRLILETEELRFFLQRIKRLLKDQRDIMGDLVDL
jgi:hypothetical protein